MQSVPNGVEQVDISVARKHSLLIYFRDLARWQYALSGYRDRRVRVQGPGWPDHCVRL